MNRPPERSEAYCIETIHNVFQVCNLNCSMGCIYRIVCHVTGKSYVGQTSYSSPFERFKQHQSSAHKGAEGPLYDDLRKYDIREFECICLRVAENSQLNELECYYAEQYNAYVWDGGYNVGECGKSVVRKDMDDERRKWMRQRAIRRNL
jgi:group I intron endonuclease